MSVQSMNEKCNVVSAAAAFTYFVGFENPEVGTVI